MPFRRDETGLAALRWWRARCLEWCYDRAEDDKFGDQAYLNDWPERFSGGVRVLRHPGAAVGPWNADRSSLERRDGRLTVKGQPLIFYHYSTIRLYRGPLTAIPRRGFLSGYYRSTPGVDSFVWATPFDIPPTMRRLVFDPYIKRLADALDDIRRVEPSFAAGIAPLSVSNLAYHAVRGLLPRRVRVAVRRLIGDRVYAAVRRPFYRPS